MICWEISICPHHKFVLRFVLLYKLLGPAAFRPRAHVVTTYTPSIEKGRPVLQGLLAIDYLTKEVNFSFNNHLNTLCQVLFIFYFSILNATWYNTWTCKFCSLDIIPLNILYI
jgi:hypothetical protein